MPSWPGKTVKQAEQVVPDIEALAVYAVGNFLVNVGLAGANLLRRINVHNSFDRRVDQLLVYLDLGKAAEVAVHQFVLLEVTFKTFHCLRNAFFAIGGVGHLKLLTVRRPIRLGELVGAAEHDFGITHEKGTAIIVAIANQEVVIEREIQHPALLRVFQKRQHLTTILESIVTGDLKTGRFTQRLGRFDQYFVWGGRITALGDVDHVAVIAALDRFVALDGLAIAIKDRAFVNLPSQCGR